MLRIPPVQRRGRGKRNNRDQGHEQDPADETYVEGGLRDPRPSDYEDHEAGEWNEFGWHQPHHLNILPRVRMPELTKELIAEGIARAEKVVSGGSAHRSFARPCRRRAASTPQSASQT